jgi:hypothetical protein
VSFDDDDIVTTLAQQSSEHLPDGSVANDRDVVRHAEIWGRSTG